MPKKKTKKKPVVPSRRDPAEPGLINRNQRRLLERIEKLEKELSGLRGRKSKMGRRG